MRTLVLGGARSGKSKLAEELAGQFGQSVIYVATGKADDLEMSERINVHRARRPAAWSTVEEPLDLAVTIKRHDRRDQTILIDCLTLWLSNLMFAEKSLESEFGELNAAVSEAEGHIVLVSNEVGLGLVPETSLGRAFRDAQGLLNQSAGNVCDRVVFVAAGLPLILKGPSLS